MDVFLGLDCGGSSTRALAVSAEGTVVGQGSSGAANILTTPEHRLRRNLAMAVKTCPEPTHVCGCFAGLVNEEARLRAIDFLKELYPNAVLRAEPDYVAAFYAASTNTDLCVIAGTGSLVCSRVDGAMVRSGGRGYMIGDQGSGYQYGRDALIAYLDDPSHASTALRDAVLDVFESDDEAVIISKLYRSATPATVVGKLVKALGSDAAAGAAYATKSLRSNSACLASVTQRHILKHHADRTELSICLAGGIWKAGQLFQREFEQQLSNLMPSVSVKIARINKPPIHGAVELARSAA